MITIDLILSMTYRPTLTRGKLVASTHGSAVFDLLGSPIKRTFHQSSLCYTCKILLNIHKRAVKYM